MGDEELACKIIAKNIDDSSPLIQSKWMEKSLEVSSNRKLLDSVYDEKVNYCVSSLSSREKLKEKTGKKE